MKTFTRGKNQEVCRESIVRKPLQEARILKNTEKHKTNLYRKQESVKKRRETRENSHTRIHITRKAFEGALFYLLIMLYYRRRWEQLINL